MFWNPPPPIPDLGTVASPLVRAEGGSLSAGLTIRMCRPTWWSGRAGERVARQVWTAKRMPTQQLGGPGSFARVSRHLCRVCAGAVEHAHAIGPTPAGGRDARMPDVAVLSNRLTEALGIRHPIVSAPMAFVAGGALAAAVTRGGGLGLIGGGYGNAQWLDEQFIAASDERVGIGFITWSLARRPELLKDALRRKPVAVMLSFGDPREFAAEIRASGAVLICQCQNLRHVRDAIEAKADIVVAQGSEAGAHGGDARHLHTGAGSGRCARPRVT